MSTKYPEEELLPLRCDEQNYKLLPFSIFKKNNQEEGPVMAVEIYQHKHREEVSGPKESSFSIHQTNTLFNKANSKFTDIHFLPVWPEYVHIIGDMDFRPHAVVGMDTVRRLAEENRKLGRPVRIHLSEGGSSNLPCKGQEDVPQMAYSISAEDLEYEESGSGIYLVHSRLNCTTPTYSNGKQTLPKLSTLFSHTDARC